MVKGIVVVDIPELDYRGCQCLREQFPLCGAIGRYIDTIVGKISNWCPIKAAPERMPEKDYDPIQDKHYFDGYDDGWNNCLNHILKED